MTTATEIEQLREELDRVRLELSITLCKFRLLDDVDLSYAIAWGTAPRPQVVCLCGSTRFKDAFERAEREETLAGRIVLTVGLFGHLEGIDMDGDIKIMLDRLHLRKIDLSDEVLVISENFYIGDSTKREIGYAIARRKLIRWWEPKTEETYRAMA
jgi:hypothetical protein